jgi:hypothetical protein
LRGGPPAPIGSSSDAAPPANPDEPRAAPGDAGASDAAQAPDAPQLGADATTYTGHVRPILARACVFCHSAGQIAPFSLDTYERAKTFAPLIARATRARTMPPVSIDNSSDCNTFRDVPWLADAEIETLERWAQQGAPEGVSDVPAPPAHTLPKLSGDVVTLKTPSYTPSKKLPDDWRCFVIDSPFKERTFVTGFDTRPGDSRTAHHMVVFYPMDDLTPVLARLSDDLEEGPGYTCFGSPGVPATILAAWAPGGGATLYPDDLGIEVVPGRPLIVQMHYNTAATAEPGPDSTAIDLQVQKDGILPGAFTQVLDLEMNLPPGQKDATEIVTGSLEGKMPKPGPAQIYGVFPHMHELGRTMHVSASTSGGQERCLVDVPRYDFHWQRMYFFDKPISVETADQLKVHCVFDTTTKTEVTKWGESTQDEMCVVGLFVKL